MLPLKPQHPHERLPGDVIYPSHLPNLEALFKADLISSSEILSILIASLSSFSCCKISKLIGGLFGGDRSSTSSKCFFQRASCSAALARISPPPPHYDRLRCSSTENSCCLTDPFEISFPQGASSSSVATWLTYALLSFLQAPLPGFP